MSDRTLPFTVGVSDRTLPFTVNLDWSTVNWVKQHRYALTLKTPAKNDPKIPSVFVVCCNFLLTLFTKAKYRDKQCGPRSDCSYRSSLIGVYTVCWKGFLTFQQTTKAIEFCFDWRFKVNRATTEPQTTKAVSMPGKRSQKT